jgi:hypothetical protein
MTRRALAPLDIPMILLKGNAFHAAGLGASIGRSVGDLDILVPRESLVSVETALIGAGWERMKEADGYDDLYYRQWMHELPPLIHRTRDRMIDVHHTILPTTARPRPDAAALIADSVMLESGLRILSPPDMIVHAAAHLFADGDLAGGLRNLWDIDRLIREFAVDPGFWPRLADRARLHQLSRPVSLALRLAGAPVRHAGRSFACRPRATLRPPVRGAAAGAQFLGPAGPPRTSSGFLRPLALAADAASDAGAAFVGESQELTLPNSAAAFLLRGAPLQLSFAQSAGRAGDKAGFCGSRLFRARRRSSRGRHSLRDDLPSAARLAAGRLCRCRHLFRHFGLRGYGFDGAPSFRASARPAGLFLCQKDGEDPARAVAGPCRHLRCYRSISSTRAGFWEYVFTGAAAFVAASNIVLATSQLGYFSPGVRSRSLPPHLDAGRRGTILSGLSVLLLFLPARPHCRPGESACDQDCRHRHLPVPRHLRRTDFIRDTPRFLPDAVAFLGTGLRHDPLPDDR